MKFNLKYLIMIILIGINSCKTREHIDFEPIYLKAISNFSTGSYFISIPVIVKSDTVHIVIQNGELFGMLFQNKVISDSIDYITKISNVIENKSSISLSFIPDSIILQYVVTPIDSIQLQLEINSKLFFSRYFKNFRLMSSILTFEQEKAIIYSLFRSKYLCRRDCITGYIILENSNIPAN